MTDTNRVVLVYIGPGRIPDIPARDLTVGDINQLEQDHPESVDLSLGLVGTGYYAFKSQAGGLQDKSQRPLYSNK